MARQAAKTKRNLPGDQGGDFLFKPVVCCKSVAIRMERTQLFQSRRLLLETGKARFPLISRQCAKALHWQITTYQYENRYRAYWTDLLLRVSKHSKFCTQFLDNNFTVPLRASYILIRHFMTLEKIINGRSICVSLLMLRVVGCDFPQERDFHSYTSPLGVTLWPFKYW